MSSCYCGEEPDDTVSIQQDCMNQKNVYNCDKEGSSSSNWKICEEIANCLRDPLSYKQKQIEKEWK